MEKNRSVSVTAEDEIEDLDDVTRNDIPPHPTIYFNRKGEQKPLPPYRYKPYPSVRYHATQPPETVLDAEDEAELGEGWGNVPIRPEDGATVVQSEREQRRAARRERQGQADK